MTDVVIASSEADARAAEAMEQHHAQLSGTLATLVERLVTAASGGEVSGAQEARNRLAAWCQRELVPHALAEEQTLYPAAWVTLDGRLLVEAMMAEHQVITGLVRSLSDDTAAGAGAGAAVRAAADAVALRVVFESHLGKENDLIIPLLLRTPGASMADLLGGMHTMLGGHPHGTPDLDTPDPDQTDDRHAGVAVDVAVAMRARAVRPTRPAIPSWTQGPSRTPSGTPPSSVPWRPSSLAVGWCWLPRTTRCHCSTRSRSGGRAGSMSTIASVAHRRGGSSS
jgi:hemerythrin-like domain-containing protein